MRRALWVLTLLIAGQVAAHPAQQSASAIDGQIAAAIASYNTLPQLEYRYREVGRTPQLITEAGVVYVELVSVATGQPVEGLIEVMPVVPGHGAVLPGQPGYDAAFAALPPSVRLRIDTSPYRPQADPELSPVADYGLPYPHGDFGTVTRSFGAHGVGKIDFDLTGRDIAAARDGTVIYANHRYQTNGAWWYWNLVVIRHGEHEYSLYGHLAQGSIPDVILATCDDNYRCDYPVKRGELIGREGNSGRSTSPHVHVAFGQRVGFVSYPDFADDNRNGNRFEPVSTAFVYAEQNIGFAGYAPDDVALWGSGRLEQAAHPTLPMLDPNVVRNGDFTSGTDGWTPIGQLNWSADNGLLRATRLRTTNPPSYAGFYQDTAVSAYANQPLELTLLLGNDSAIAKTATVELLNASGRQYGVLSRDFTIAPNAPLELVGMCDVPGSTWADVRVQISVNPADGSPALLVDDIVLRLLDPTESMAC